MPFPRSYLSFDSLWAVRGTRAHTYAGSMQIVWHACLHTLTSGISAVVPLLRPTGVEGNQLFPPVEKRSRVCPPAAAAPTPSTRKRPGICHRRGRIASAHTRGRLVVCSERSLLTPPLTGTREDLKVRGEASEQAYKSETCPLRR